MKNIFMSIIILLMTACGTVPLVQPEAVLDVTVTPTLTIIPVQPSLQTVVFTVNDKEETGIYQGQIDNKSRQIEDIVLTDFPVSSDVRIYGLFPAPIGEKVAIHWNQANTSYISILDTLSGKITPLLDEPLGWYQGATFLDWHPDGQNILVFGFPGSDLDGSAWIVDVESHEYYDVDIKQKDSQPKITNAIFSPDGNTIVYGQQECAGCEKNQIWRIDLDGSNRQLLFEDSSPAYGVDGLTWSPDGNYIAFLHWQRYPSSGATGNLYVMKADGGEQRLLSSAMIDLYGRFKPRWSTDSQRLLFIKSDNTTEQFTNLYTVDLTTNRIIQLTNLQSNQLFRPIWSSDNSEIIFLADLDGNIKLWTIPVDNGIHSRGVEDAIQYQEPRSTKFSDLDNYSDLVMLP